MTYSNWYKVHSAKHKDIVTQLIQQNMTINDIIDYFDYENMVSLHNDFCLLYATHSKCHEMNKLNCYMCGCPYFRFSDSGIESIDGKTIYSKCVKNLGATFESDTALHHDCSLCEVPHKRKFVSDNFDISWERIMSEVDLGVNP